MPSPQPVTIQGWSPGIETLIESAETMARISLGLAVLAAMLVVFLLAVIAVGVVYRR